jgi:hypothetical protein
MVAPKQKRTARGKPPPRTKQRPRAPTREVTLTNVKEVIRHTNVLVIALQEVLDYDPVRGHNQPPPPLWNEDRSYLGDVGSLVRELRRLNSLLEAKRPRKKEASRAVIDLAGHFNHFLHSYTGTLGKGMAGLTVLAMANLLLHAGVDPTSVWSAIKPH